MGCDLSPLQVLAEFPELPYVPFGQESPSMNAELRDVGEERARRQNSRAMGAAPRSPHHLYADGPEVATERDETCQPLKLATSLN